MQALTGSKVAVLLMLGAVKLVFGLAPLVIARSFGSKRNNDGLKNVVGKFIENIIMYAIAASHVGVISIDKKSYTAPFFTFSTLKGIWLKKVGLQLGEL